MMIPQWHLFVEIALFKQSLLLTAKEKSSKKVRTPDSVLGSNSREICTYSHEMSHYDKKNTEFGFKYLSYTPFIQAISKCWWFKEDT